MRPSFSRLFILLPLAFYSCSKHEAPPPPPPPPAGSLVHIEAVASLEQAQEIAHNATIACEPQAPCPPGVAMFLAADAAGGFDKAASVATCTAFLVGPDLALTNSHCIPGHVKQLPDLCSERVRLAFPPSGAFPEESVGCRKLIGFSERANAISPDLALLRLDRKLRRPPFLMSRGGIAPGKAFLTHKIARVNGSLKGSLKSEKCKAINNSYRMPIYREKGDPLFVLGDCAALPGNSGAPALNESGMVAGVMQAELPISQEARAEWGQHLAPAQDFSRLALGTSLSCLLAAPPAWEWNPACAKVEETSVLEVRPRVRQFLSWEGLADEQKRVLQPFLNQTPVLEWQHLELETKALSRQEALSPKCFRAPEDWGQWFRDEEGGLLETAELELKMPRYEMDLVFNRYLQPTGARVSVLEAEPRSWIFHPGRIAADSHGLLTPASGDGEPVDLRICAEEN